MKWQRARSEEQKEQRISEIVGAAARLYKTHSFEEISSSLIAKEAGFTRSNLYKYFSSKEEIFLAFLMQDMRLWSADLLKTCRRRKITSIEKFASVWVKIMVKHQRFLDLLSLLPTYLPGEKRHRTKPGGFLKKRCQRIEGTLGTSVWYVSCIKFPESRRIYRTAAGFSDWFISDYESIGDSAQSFRVSRI